MKRIGIDARFYGSVGKGLGRYTAKLIEHLERIAPPDLEFVVFLRRGNFAEYEPKSRQFRKVLADYAWYGFREQLFFPWRICGEHVDLMHFPHFNVPILYRQSFVVTIHDLILLNHPTVRNTTRSRFTYWLKFLVYRFVIASAIRRARKILTVSRFTEADIVREYPGAAGKITVAYEGSEIVGDEERGAMGNLDGSGESVVSHGILSPYFLYVGNAYPHKNLEIFIPLAKQFPNIQFVLVGKEDFFYRRLRCAVEEAGVHNIIFAGFVPDRSLAVLYRDAYGYIFPSFYEGFGLPPLEAMRYGTPVVASREGSLPEVLGDAALYFDPRSIEELTLCVERLLTEKGLRENLSRKGIERSKRFRWEETAEAALSVYQQSLKR